MVRIWLIVAIAAVGASAQGREGIPLLADCSNPEDVVATVQATDHVQVRYGLGGNTQTCYAVSVTLNGKDVAGYLLGAAHPDVAAFEREARSHVPPIPDPPAPAPAAAAATETKQNDPAPQVPKSFAELSGISPDGHHRVSLGSFKQPMVVVYFWSANDKRSIREADAMDGVYEMYRGKSVGLVGVVSGASTAQVRKVINEGEVIWPQILDNGAIAARYPESKQTRYFILDRNRNVVAALKSSGEVQRELVKLRKQTGGSE